MKNYITSTFLISSILLGSFIAQPAFASHFFTRHGMVSPCGKTWQDGHNDNNNNNCNINTNTNNNSNNQEQNQSQNQEQNNNQEQNFNPSIDNNNNNNITIGSFAPPIPQQQVVVQSAPMATTLPSTGSPLPQTLMLLGSFTLGLLLRKFKKSIWSLHLRS